MANRDKSPQLGLNDDKLELLVRDLIKKRGTLKGRLTKFGTYINNFDANVVTPQNKIDLKLRIEGATNLYREFDSIQSRIEECVSETDLDDQLTQREQFEDCYYSTLSQAELLSNRCGSSSSSKVTACSKTCENSQLRSVKLPTITLPSFDGSYEHWLEFRDTFQSLIHDSDEINTIQKFHYLKSSLKRSAELVIDALEFTSSNYSVAWELLLDRYNNNRLLIQNHIKTIFNIQPLSKESPVAIRTLSDTILKNIRALKILGEPVDSWDTLIIFIIVSKLDKTTEREWEQHKGTLITNNNDSKLKLKVDDLINFLKNRADMLETLHSSQINKQSIYTKNDRMKSTKCNVSSTKPHERHSAPKNCVMCNGAHQLYACSQFIDSNLESKLKFLRDRKLCENCMKSSSHTAEFCKFGGCRRCFKKHNSLIHPSDDLNHPPDDTKTIGNTSGSLTMHSSFDNNRQLMTGARAVSLPSGAAPLLNPADAVCYANNAHSNDKRTHRSLQPVLLSTALIEVRTRNNVYLLANALLDNGSERSFITEAFSKKLGVELLQSTHEIRGVGNSVTQCTKSCDIEIKSRISTYTTKLHCFILPLISSTLPAVHYERAKFRIPNSLQLADPHFLDSRKIDILIGADIFWELIHEGNIRLPNGPYLQNTHLGWIISGPIVFNTRNDRLIQCNFTQSIDTQLRQFWEIEELPRDRDTRTDAERACEELFTRTTTRNDEGRFIVSIPLKSSPDLLGESLPQAERRFLALEKRLERTPAYKKLYADFLHEYESLGHMTRVSTYGTPHYFMPHHGVFRENHSTTKLRVVYDAGAVSSTGISYNDLQLVGPPIQGDLISIILRFRQHRYVACADIEKMYRQCLVDEKQRDLQLILWRDEPTQPLGVYRLNTVTYGTASAPFLSCRCLKQLACETTNPEVSRIINEDFYVDDMITGSHDKETLLKLCEETTKTLQAGCFPLRKWIFNFTCEPEMTSSSCASKQILAENTNHETLGIGWLNDSDEFYFNTEFESSNEPITKRIILSYASQIFDPLGILSPFILTAKLLLQQLWLLKLDWDDIVPTDIARQWNRFLASLSILKTIRVPRYVMDIDPISTEMHIFSDASQTAYGACVYIRTVSANTVKVQLLCSKGKVAPLKTVSIPRLELLGALVGARLYNKVRDSLHCNFDHVIFWTDSTIVLGWLRMPPRLLKTFVQNRTIEIHDLTKDLPWRHVSGKENPADLVSRGVVNLEELSSSKLWWEGPAFLRDSEFDCENVPPFYTHEGQSSDLPEIKGSDVTALVAQDRSSSEDGSIMDFQRFSQFGRLRRSTAYVLRFLHNTRNKLNKRSGVLTVDELREADNLLVRLSQLESFPVEYKSIANNRALKNKHNLSKLNLFIDDNKLLRVGGRLDYSEFDYNKKHPILLSGKHHFTLLLFRHEHKSLLHAAPQALLFHLRESWWPIAGRWSFEPEETG
ncbi:uncharacterized protein LOC123866731 [Maniola jurtina]|uniref:uncharacterized protein LOC123866731 n=1 Tax=Maniola jurtina TaxID=191418 RepID=UPI001E68EDCE|nr:uncharacterized protein LOC123866731 [Maniola jurtina]